MELFRCFGLCVGRTFVFLGLTILLIPSLFILTVGFLTQLDVLPQVDQLVKDDETRDIVDHASLWAKFSIVLGAALVVHVAIGFLSACCSNRPLLFTHALLGLGVVACGVWITAYGSGQVRSYVKGKEDILITHYNRDKSSDGSRQLMDEIQSRYHCCGIDGSTDWFMPHGSYLPGTFPFSCCGKEKGVCSLLDPYYQTGCREKMDEFVDAAVGVGMCFVLALTIVQLLVVIAASCVALGLRQQMTSSASTTVLIPSAATYHVLTNDSQVYGALGATVPRPITPSE